MKWSEKEIILVVLVFINKLAKLFLFYYLKKND